MSATSLTDLARAILDSAQQVEDYLRANNLPQPSFDEHSPPEVPVSPELQKVKQKAIDAAIDIRHLLEGPAMQARPVLNATSLNAIYTYNIPAQVPLDSHISFQDLADKTGLSRPDLQRILRFAMAHHKIFQEKTPGFVSHSAASRYLAENDTGRAALGFMFEECYQSFAHTVESLKTYPDAEPNQSGWAIALKSDVPMWDYHTQHPAMGERAAKAMAAFTKGTGQDTKSLTEGYDWTQLNAKGGTLIDLGGADGFVATEIARLNPQMHFIVQEIPAVVEKAKYQVPGDVKEQVSIVAHDFFKPQPTSADVYLFRQIFHNWSDRHCVEMLRALVPALKPGAKVIINERLLPPPGVLPPVAERGIRAMDMIMMSLFNARERSREDFEQLFAEADSRFAEIKVWSTPGASLGVAEATWSG